jgi:hypothetical protein
MEGNDWLRVRGVGRERLGRYLAEFLEESGYAVTELEEPLGPTPSFKVTATLRRPHHAIPPALGTITVRFLPTAGGCQAVWEGPVATLAGSDRARAERFVAEILARLDQRVATETRGTSRLVRERPGTPPFLPPAPSPAAPPSPAPARSASPRGEGHPSPAEGF